MDDMNRKGRGKRVPAPKNNKYSVRHTIIIDWKEFQWFKEAGRYLWISDNWVRKRMKSDKFNIELIQQA